MTTYCLRDSTPACGHVATYCSSAALPAGKSSPLTRQSASAEPSAPRIANRRRPNRPGESNNGLNASIDCVSRQHGQNGCSSPPECSSPRECSSPLGALGALG